jgi:lipoate-protein ligase A
VPQTFSRTVRLVETTEPAVVLGSTQPAVPDRGVTVVRRRSGGGAVLVGPGEVVWADVFVPAGDPLWEQDVGVAFHWLGDVWTAALRSLDVDGRSHRGPMVCTPWCRQVCFAGIGSGEVTVTGKKVVGIAQRRVRAGSLFHCAALLRWDPPRLVELLDLPVEAEDELARLAAAVEAARDDLERAFLSALDASDA